MMFIKLTERETGVAMRVNVNQILTYGREKGKEVTQINVLDLSKSTFVLETPEEIDRKIEQVTDRAVGGER